MHTTGVALLMWLNPANMSHCRHACGRDFRNGVITFLGSLGDTPPRCVRILCQTSVWFISRICLERLSPFNQIIMTLSMTLGTVAAREPRRSRGSEFENTAICGATLYRLVAPYQLFGHIRR
jgi:hypothetical protein